MTILASAVVFGLVLTPVRTYGISMQPTLDSGRLVFVNRLAYVFDLAPRRGDLVAIRLAGPNALYLKRVVALPYERVSIDEGRVIVDGRELDEPYVARRQPWTYAEITLGEREFFVIGDNRGMPQALHEFGRVSRDRILGKVVFW